MKKFLSTSLSKGRRKNRIRIVVAMSGGVDSSVAAALLKKQGYDVVGVFMRFWSEPADSQFNSPHPPLKIRGGEERRNTCCSEGAEAAARAVAAKLDIPFYVLRLEKEFKKAVVDYFLIEEKRGRTPNPCVVCNKKIKFGILFKKALGMGADFVATGHYARIKKVWSSAFMQRQESRPKGRSPIYKLFCAEDKEKNQSYFLYALTQKQLSRILFPIGDYTKEKVYQMAKKWKLPYRKGESFDLCFVAKDRESFIKKYLKLKPGKIVKYQLHPACQRLKPQAMAGRPSPLLKKERGDDVVLGEHQGLPLYTIGQRKSLPLQQGPWWVVGKDERKNILYVSNNEKDLYSRQLVASQINWINGKQLRLPMKVWAKIRYKSEAVKTILRSPTSEDLRSRTSKILKVIFKKPQRAITSGQSVVFYSRDGEVLGGGIIK